MNRELKAEIVRRYGSQSNFARASGFAQSKISRIIHGRRSASLADRERLEEIFGSRRARQLLRRPAGQAASHTPE